MKVTYHQAKNNVYVQLPDGTILRRNRKTGKVSNFTGEIPGFPYTLETPDDDVWAGYLKKMRDDQIANDAKREKHEMEMKDVGTRIETATSRELYDYIIFLANRGKGWDAADILLGRPSNELSKITHQYLGSGYTATPFDDGQIFVKARNGKRLSLKRHHKSVALYSIL